MPWACCWAQLGGTGTAVGGTTTPAGARSLPVLSLERWFGSLTLSPPAIPAGEVPAGIWALLGGIGALAVIVLAVQGPRRAIVQFGDIPGHLALWDAAVRRVRRSVRLLMVVVGVSVISWTAAQTLRYAGPAGRDDLALLLKDRRVVDVAWAQGALAALTPLRDVVGLGLMIPMLLGAAFVLFQYSTFRWSAIRPDPSIRLQATRWATIGWGVTALYAIYRFVGLVSSGFSDRPLGGCTMVEALLVPIVMALADGVLVAWVLVELRHGGEAGDDRLDVTGVVLTIPAAIAGCLLTFPARYLATGVALGSDYLPLSVLAIPGAATFLRWELGWGLMAWQAAGLVFAGWLGAAAWSRPGGAGVARDFARLLANDGARVVVALAAAGLAAGVLSAAAYAVVLSLPGASWVLGAADSYAHYATLPVGLVLLGALVELGGRSAATAPKAAEPKSDALVELAD